MRQYLTITLLFIFIQISSQNPPNENLGNQVVRMPNAEMTNLGKFTDAPVSLSKGTPSIDVLLCEIKTGDFSLPISLNYHAAGVKVDEIASWVGMGWKISAEGMIMRQQRGNPDENMYFNSNTISNFINGDQDQLMRDYLSQSATGDYEADLFTFSFGNYTGNFMFDQLSQKFINTINQNFKHEFISGTNSKWKITDNLGNLYIFTALGKTDSFFSINGNLTRSPEDRPTGPLTWKLTQIITRQNKKIDFYYLPHLHSNDYYQPTLFSRKILLNGYLGMPQPPSSCIKPYESTEQFDTDYMYSLDKIVSDDMIINFIWGDQERLDSKTKNLKEIEIRNQSNNLIKKYKLSYSFIKSSSSEPTSNPRDSYRMYLDQIDVQFTDTNIETYRKFSYHNREGLPKRLSSKQDYWGYHNNEENLRLYPKTWINFKDRNNINQKIIVDGGNRRVNELYTQDGILNKIILPTKGEINYIYESNWVKADSVDTEVQKLLNPIEKSNYYFYKSPDSAHNSEYKYQYHFSVPNNLLKIESQINVTGCQSDLLNDLSCHYQFAIFNDNAIPFPSMPFFAFGNKKQSFELPAGNYVLAVKPMDEDFSETNQFDIILDVSYQVVLNKFLVGGVRVKEIEFKDNGIVKLKKKYNYNYFNTDVSSGKIQNIPTYVKIYDDKKKCKVNLTYNDFDLKIAEVKSVPFLPLYDNSGVGITYANATEETIDLQDPSNSFKSEYIFSYKPDIIQSISNSKNILPVISNAHQRGNLIEKNDYVNKNGLLDAVKNTKTYYQPKERIYSNYYITNYYDELNYNEGYATGLGYTQIDSIRTTEKLNGNNINIAVVKTYNNDTKNLTSENIISGGNSTQINYQYAHEKGNQKLIDANMVGITLETTTLKDNKALSKVETIYPDQNHFPTTQAGNLLLPLSIRSTIVPSISTLNPPVGEVKETEITYDQYDNKGNLQQYTPKSGIPVVIIWGYNKTQPIAKIEGATYAQVADYITDIVNYSDTDASLGSDGSEQDLIDKLDAFRKKSQLAAFQITTYTHDPLIGVRSITPPSGIRELYTYDTANRLETVKDVNGNILKEYEYHYKP